MEEESPGARRRLGVSLVSAGLLMVAGIAAVNLGFPLLAAVALLAMGAVAAVVTVQEARARGATLGQVLRALIRRDPTSGA